MGAPVPIENNVKEQIDAIGECMMIGDKRKYNVVMITLKAKGANGEVPGSDDLEASNFRNEMASAGANNNSKVCPNPSFRIGKFMIMPHNFSEEGQELTPTKKLKRAVVEKKYGRQIEHLYATAGTYIKWVE